MVDDTGNGYNVPYRFNSVSAASMRFTSCSCVSVDGTAAALAAGRAGAGAGAVVEAGDEGVAEAAGLATGGAT